MNVKGMLTSTSIIATALTVGLALPSVAQAQTYPYHGSKIMINGQQTSAPAHIVAADPFAGTNAADTSFVPIYYIDTALSNVGISATWDGHNLKLNIPSGMTVNYPVAPKPMNLTSTVMTIQINVGTIDGGQMMFIGKKK